MQLHQVKKKHLKRFLKDLEKGEGYTKLMLPRAKAEMPLYTSVAIAFADSAKRDFEKAGSITSEEIRRLVCESWMAGLRLLELAALDGEKTSSEQQLSQVLMGDPLTNPPSQSLANASEEVAQLMTKSRLNTKLGDKK